MQRMIANAVRQQFERQLKSAFSQFTLNRTALIPPGCRLHEQKLANGRALFLFLIFSPRDDSFTIEIGWSETGTIPRSGCALPTDGTNQGGVMFRVSRLWQQFGFDYWWQFDPERNLENFAAWSPLPMEVELGKVSELVDDAMIKLVTHAKPYFEQIAAERGQFLL